MPAHTSREQTLVNICFQLVFATRERYGPGPMRSEELEELASWVASQLRQCGFPTRPIGASWGILDDRTG